MEVTDAVGGSLPAGFYSVCPPGTGPTAGEDTELPSILREPLPFKEGEGGW